MKYEIEEKIMIIDLIKSYNFVLEQQISIYYSNLIKAHYVLARILWGNFLITYTTKN